MLAGRGEARAKMAEVLMKDLIASVMAPDALRVSTSRTGW